MGLGSKVAVRLHPDNSNELHSYGSCSRYRLVLRIGLEYSRSIGRLLSPASSIIPYVSPGQFIWAYIHLHVPLILFCGFPPHVTEIHSPRVFLDLRSSKRAHR